MQTPLIPPPKTVICDPGFIIVGELYQGLCKFILGISISMDILTFNVRRMEPLKHEAHIYYTVIFNYDLFFMGTRYF